MKTIPQKQNCMNCEPCEYHLDSGYDPELCFFYEFWSQVLDNKENHFKDNESVYFFTTGEGGFNNHRYTIKFKDGTILHNMGVWHRGEAPSKVLNQLKTATWR